MEGHNVCYYADLTPVGIWCQYDVVINVDATSSRCIDIHMTSFLSLACWDIYPSFSLNTQLYLDVREVNLFTEVQISVEF